MIEMIIKPVPKKPALILESNKRFLLIADLHIGIESRLASTGISYRLQTDSIIEEIRSIIKDWKITNLIILGDLKDRMGSYTISTRETKKFLSEMSKLVPIMIIKGNHDGNIEDVAENQATIINASGILIENVFLCHGHAWPSEKVLKANTLIMAHNHPVFVFEKKIQHPLNPWDERVVKRKAMPVFMKFYLDKKTLSDYIMGDTEDIKEQDSQLKVIIMPSFNQIVSGVPVNDMNVMFIGPIFENGLVNTSEIEIINTEGIKLGRLRSLPKTS